MKLQVHAPAGAQFTGVVAGVAFAHGVATIDSDADRKALAYFRRKGYRTEAAAAPPQAPAEVKRPGKSGSKAAWVTYAVAQGVTAEKAEALTAAQLAEQIDALIAEVTNAETENGGQQ